MTCLLRSSPHPGDGAKRRALRTLSSSACPAGPLGRPSHRRSWPLRYALLEGAADATRAKGARRLPHRPVGRPCESRRPPKRKRRLSVLCRPRLRLGPRGIAKGLAGQSSPLLYCGLGLLGRQDFRLAWRLWPIAPPGGAKARPSPAPCTGRKVDGTRWPAPMRAGGLGLPTPLPCRASPASSPKSLGQPGYLPRKAGLRFSLKARTPSAKSSEVRRNPYRRPSSFSPCCSGPS